MKTNNPLKYSNCWEDAFLIRSSLQIDAESKVMSIASAGDNSFMLLADHPKEMVCLDLNEIQLALTELKEQAIKNLTYKEFLQLLGFEESDIRGDLFLKIKENISESSQSFLSSEMIEGGIVHLGKFEQYFQLFSKKILPLIHSNKRIMELFEKKSSAEQKNFYNKSWNSLRWRLLFRIFFSKYVMGKRGREPEKLKEVKLNVGKEIFKRAGKHLSSVESQNNYMLGYILSGNFNKCLPPYAQVENFRLTKAWLQENEIQYFHGDLESCLLKYPDFNRFNLSNIFEYMPVDLFKKQVLCLDKYSSPGSICSYWNLMVLRDFSDFSDFQRLETSNDDLGFFYQQFFNYRKRN